MHKACVSQQQRGQGVGMQTCTVLDEQDSSAGYQRRMQHGPRLRQAAWTDCDRQLRRLYATRSSRRRGPLQLRRCRHACEACKNAPVEAEAGTGLSYVQLV